MAGVALGIVAGMLLTQTLSHLRENPGRYGRDEKKPQPGNDGPLRWVRHPFYRAFALAVVANALVTANWFVFATGCLAFLLLVIRCRKEEDNLIARFGEEYRTYAQRTGRFLPR